MGEMKAVRLLRRFLLFAGLFVQVAFFAQLISSNKHGGAFGDSNVEFPVETDGIHHRPFNVLFGLSGNATGFISEWEVALKSVLLNAPIDSPLQIFCLTDSEAFHAAHDTLKRAQLEGSLWRNSITVTFYLVEKYHEEWEKFLQAAIGDKNELEQRVTIGGYYRLMASKVLPTNTGHVLYMDADSVITANLHDLRQYFNNTTLYQWSGSWPCSGFMLINMDLFDSFFQQLRELPPPPSGGDQVLLAYLAEQRPHIAGALPLHWDVNLGHGWRRRPQLLLTGRPQVSAIHFNGIRPSYFYKGLDFYCNRTPKCTTDEDRELVRKTWGMADYYIRIDWSWVLHLGQSMIKGKGVPLRIAKVV